MKLRVAQRPHSETEEEVGLALTRHSTLLGPASGPCPGRARRGSGDYPFVLGLGRFRSRPTSGRCALGPLAPCSRAKPNHLRYQHGEFRAGTSGGVWGLTYRMLGSLFA